MNLFQKIVIITLAIFASISSMYAQSALYIQGDKNTPIYVKVEGQMMPRQGMNYCIVPGLEAGSAHFEVLFQGNKYPVQKYLITIPEDGVRGLLLTKVDDQNFALFDLQTQGYIYNNNTTDEAFLQLNPIQSNTVVTNNNSTTTTSPKEVKRPKEEKQQKEVKQQKETDISDNSKSNNRFIDNIDLTETKTREKTNVNDKGILVEEKLFKSKDDGVVKSKNQETNTTISTTETTIPNTDCTTAMNEGTFETFLGTFSAQSDDESKIKYIKKNYEKRCFSTEQAGILANMTNGQSSRFEILQIIFPRVTDQSNYGNLEKLFATDFLKKRFNAMLKN